MSTWKHIGYVSAALLPVILSGCYDNYAIRPYHGVPYCCDRTAGTGPEYYCAETRRTKRVAMSQPAPTNIEPAAGGEKVFYKAIQK